MTAGQVGHGGDVGQGGGGGIAGHVCGGGHNGQSGTLHSGHGGGR